MLGSYNRRMHSQQEEPLRIFLLIALPSSFTITGHQPSHSTSRSVVPQSLYILHSLKRLDFPALSWLYPYPRSRMRLFILPLHQSTEAGDTAGRYIRLPTHIDIFITSSLLWRKGGGYIWGWESMLHSEDLSCIEVAARKCCRSRGLGTANCATWFHPILNFIWKWRNF